MLRFGGWGVEFQVHSLEFRELAVGFETGSVLRTSFLGFGLLGMRTWDSKSLRIEVLG